jgi:hypothetical protein
VLQCLLLMLWTAPALRHQRAKGWSREANHVEGSRARKRWELLLEKYTKGDLAGAIGIGGANGTNYC